MALHLEELLKKIKMFLILLWRPFGKTYVHDLVKSFATEKQAVDTCQEILLHEEDLSSQSGYQIAGKSSTHSKQKKELPLSRT